MRGGPQYESKPYRAWNQIPRTSVTGVSRTNMCHADLSVSQTPAMKAANATARYSAGHHSGHPKCKRALSATVLIRQPMAIVAIAGHKWQAAITDAGTG